MPSNVLVDLVIGIAVLAAVVVLPVLYIFLRIRWLIRLGGTFECSARRAGGIGWMLGVARYAGDQLEWFRYFALSVQPDFTLPRHSGSVQSLRTPDATEAKSLHTGHKIALVQPGPDHGQPWELAMSGESLTGMLSWLEAAPPGQVPRNVSSPGSA